MNTSMNIYGYVFNLGEQKTDSAYKICYLFFIRPNLLYNPVYINKHKYEYTHKILI